MMNLFIIDELFTNGYKAEMLDIISILSIFCGILVIISKNPIVSVLYLIGLFLSISSYLLILGVNFIGLSYLLVYVGAVSILFLFILMLINVRVSELLSDTSNSIPLAIMTLVLFNYPVSSILPYNMINGNYFNNFLSNIFSSNSVDNQNILLVTGNIWDGNLAETSHISTIGNIMYTSYSMWLIITSIILLLAMVGAIVITIKQKN